MANENGNSGRRVPQTCILCEGETNIGRICDKCFFSPEVVRPQAVLSKWILEAQKVLNNGGEPLSFWEWAMMLTRDDFAEMGLTESDWQIWEAYKRWRDHFQRGEVTIYDSAWRRFVVDSHKEMLGSRMIWLNKKILDAWIKEVMK